MKKLCVLFILLLAVLAVAGVHNTADANGKTARGVIPADIVTIPLTDTDTTDACDTMAADKAGFIGPFQLADGSNEPMYKTMKIIVRPGCVASGDSFQIAYQLLATNNINDTISSWDVVDTADVAGKAMTEVDISGKVGNYILFRIYNVDSTRIEIQNRIWAMFKRAKTFFRQQ